MRVDLPAPLSPTSATTSPAWTSKSTSVRASTAPNRFVTPLISRSGRSEAAVAVDTYCSPLLALADAVLGARGLERTGAHVVRLPEPILDDGSGDVVGGDCRDRQLDRRNVDRAVVLGRRGISRLLALDESDGPGRRLLGERLDRLVD